MARTEDVDPETAFRSDIVPSSKPRILGVLGPGLITGASDDDPSGIATYSQVGAQMGYNLSWTLLFSYPLMSSIQMLAARIGRTTGLGLAGNLRRHYPVWLMHAVVGLLLIANAINIGADLGAMGDALALLIKGPRLVYVVAFGAACVAAQVWVNYARYVSVLKWMTLVLLAYFGVVAVVRVDWGVLASQFFIPHLQWSADYLTGVVAVFGTTISPYLFFWQASQEVEDIDEHPRREALTRAPRQGGPALKRIELDTLVGMGLSNLVALAILVTAAATLNANHVTDIDSAAKAAEALKPIAGDYAFIVFSLGIIGTGLLAVPVLAGSVAYGIGEAQGWEIGLARKPREAKAFYATIAVATVIGVALNFTPVDPIKALFWSAVVNGVVAVPVMVIMLLIGARSDVMGEFIAPKSMKIVGWLATVVMALAAVGMFVSLI